MSQGFLSEVRRLEHSATDKTDIPRDEPDAVADPQDTQEANLPDPVSSSQTTESQITEQMADQMTDQMTEEAVTSAFAHSLQEDTAQPTPDTESTMPDSNESVQSVQSSPHEQKNSAQDESAQDERIQDESVPNDGLENIPPASGDNPIQVTESTISVEQHPLEEAQLEETRTVNVEVVEPESYLSDVNMESSQQEEPIFSVLDAQVVTSSDVADSDSDDDFSDDATSSTSALNSTPDVSEQLEEAIAQLDVRKQREAKLNARIQELEAQLSQQTQTVEKLRLDLEVIQTSKKEILADLAEAKRYVLQLTDLKQSSAAQEELKQTDSSPAIAPPLMSSVDSGHRSMHRSNGRSPQPNPSPQPTSFPTPGRQSIPIRPKKHASTRSPVLSSSALKGLPPMSTERLKASPMSQPQLPSPDPSPPSQPHSSRALSRVPRPHGPQPASPHESQAKQDSQSQQDSQPKGIQLQKAYRRPLVHHRDRPIPQVARDTRTAVPKPKLSDSEISWFD